MTVTDLTAGAWCELQYWYTLTRLPGGRRTKTAAMRQGSKVHQALEDEVHTTVKIEILTKEDGFGLKLWNLVQGLRTLRDTGLTRELEVWGTIDGTFVNGVIDSVSYDNPNPDFQEELSSQESQVDHEQSRLTDFFPPREDKSKRRKQVKAYIADVKTRGSVRPVTNVLLRPAKIQLLLYYRFLADMAAGRLDFFKLFRRYGLDADDTFSDAFIAQIGSLHDDIFVDASMSIDENPQSSGQALDGGPNSSWSTEPESSQDGPDLLRYKTLRELVPLVQQELELTFPEGEDSLGHILRVQYVHRNDGKQINVHDFPVSKQALENFLGDYMPWWKGEREAQGVSIEEAFKCRTCEFASDCTWRQEIDEEMVRKAQEKMHAKRTNGY
jgi:exonuclease V